MHPVRLAIVARFVDIATDALADAREEIDALNVFPVPDGDTGTNMFLTMSAARESLRQALEEQGLGQIARDAHAGAPVPGDVGAEQVGAALRALARGALLGARGNSGVILAQMLGALTHHLQHAPADGRAAVLVAEALDAASRAAYDAVSEPVEGTILTVARAAGRAAVAESATDGARTRDVYVAAAAAARAALQRTPEQLPTLADAGVVDAGGRGLTVILDAAETALTGRRPLAPRTRLGAHTIPVAAGAVPAPGTPAYEVMYLLADASRDDVAVLRARLAELGDSVVVVGDEDLWNVHAHVDDAGAAVEAGVRAGRPHQIRITHFGAAHDHDHAPHDPADAPGAPADDAPHEPVRRVAGRAVVAVSAGPGLAEVFTQAGATAVPGGPGDRPSAGQLLDAVRSTGAAEVVILPNDPDSVRTAEVAARTAEEDGDVRVAVVPSRAQVQGLAALAVHEPGRGFGPDVLEMTAAARHCRHGAVTRASKRAITSAGPCEPGDVLGVVMGDFAVVGDDATAVAVEVLTRLLAVGGELVTIVAGEDSDGLVEDLVRWLETEHRGVDVVTYDGGQPRYPLLVSVE